MKYLTSKCLTAIGMTLTIVASFVGVIGCGNVQQQPIPKAEVQQLPARMIVISAQTYRSRNITVLKDKETGQEFLWVDYGDCMSITPIQQKEER